MRVVFSPFTFICFQNIEESDENAASRQASNGNLNNSSSNNMWVFVATFLLFLFLLSIQYVTLCCLIWIKFLFILSDNVIALVLSLFLIIYRNPKNSKSGSFRASFERNNPPVVLTLTIPPINDLVFSQIVHNTNNLITGE